MASTVPSPAAPKFRKGCRFQGILCFFSLLRVPISSFNRGSCSTSFSGICAKGFAHRDQAANRISFTMSCIPSMLWTVTDTSSFSVDTIKCGCLVLADFFAIHNPMILRAETGVLCQGAITAAWAHGIHSNQPAFFGVLPEFREVRPHRVRESCCVHCDVFHDPLVLFNTFC